jgi:hypothetical protein
MGLFMTFPPLKYKKCRPETVGFGLHCVSFSLFFQKKEYGNASPMLLRIPDLTIFA